MKADLIILAGGLGTRLRSVVSDLPKPMAPVNGRPFLQYILERLNLLEIRQIVFSIGYMGEKIQDSFGESFGSVPIKYAPEKEPLGTGGGIKLALDHCSSDQVIILNGDTYFEIDLSELLSFHRSGNWEISIGLKSMESPDRYGTVEMEIERILAFKEKRLDLESGLINAGVYCINRNLLDDYPLHEKFSFETDVLEKNVDKWSIGGMVSEGMFIDIGIPEDYERASEILE
jgi:D-glycero-alpha-D-manno-heptose 1-phosphate guanylyltransferase